MTLTIVLFLWQQFNFTYSGNIQICLQSGHVDFDESVYGGNKYVMTDVWYKFYSILFQISLRYSDLQFSGKVSFCFESSL